jgi:transcriptional regulator with XRE-family HTH domain
MRIFGERLKARARELGLTDVEVARRAGLNDRRYAHYVSNAREPDLATLVRISRTLDTTPNDLLGISSTEIEPVDRQQLLSELMSVINSLSEDGVRIVIQQSAALIEYHRTSSNKD